MDSEWLAFRETTSKHPLSTHVTDRCTETLPCEPVYDRATAGNQDRKFSLRNREVPIYYGLHITYVFLKSVMHLVYLAINNMKLTAKTSLLSNSISALFSPDRIYSRNIYSNTNAKTLMQITKKNHQRVASLLLLLLVPSLPSTGQVHQADAISSRLEMALLPPGAALVSVVIPPGICC